MGMYFKFYTQRKDGEYFMPLPFKRIKNKIKERGIVNIDHECEGKIEGVFVFRVLNLLNYAEDLKKIIVILKELMEEYNEEWEDEGRISSIELIVQRNYVDFLIEDQNPRKIITDAFGGYFIEDNVIGCIDNEPLINGDWVGRVNFHRN